VIDAEIMSVFSLAQICSIANQFNESAGVIQEFLAYQSMTLGWTWACHVHNVTIVTYLDSYEMVSAGTMLAVIVS
jgi:hypothetical protein